MPSHASIRLRQDPPHAGHSALLGLDDSFAGRRVIRSRETTDKWSA